MNRFGGLFFALVLAGLIGTGCASKSDDMGTPSDSEMTEDSGMDMSDMDTDMGDMSGMDTETDPMTIISNHSRVNFEFDQAALRSEDRDKLQRVADAMKLIPEVQLTIEGHCDERGSNEYNLALGERRARAVRGYLQNLGVSANRLGTISYGEERPLEMGSNEMAWTENRRADLVINR